jgi:hypothetical protein
MPHLNAILTDEQVQRIKLALWNGELLTDLAKKFEVSNRTISAIRCGSIWPEVKWPDGATGAINKTRRKEVTRARRQPENKAAQQQLARGAKKNGSGSSRKKGR